MILKKNYKLGIYGTNLNIKNSALLIYFKTTRK